MNLSKPILSAMDAHNHYQKSTKKPDVRLTKINKLKTGF